ncbi:MAG: septal ring lytic transglycosylase RlpA family protein [Arenimonas sp.]|nr:septal ring lytic transglycosylase RlpA family protein [Arenimonas sp.]MBP6626056.1 septal ring lytic transglycosylase RlpA family protein [Arenimonas sp.]
MRAAPGVMLLALLAGCADKPVKPAVGEPAPTARAPQAAAAPVAAGVPPACLQVREHRDEDYTPGGLYAPGVSDSAPQHALDISGIAEPQPRAEPASAYGNRTPYTVLGKSYRVLPKADGYVERGLASWYGQKFHGRQTSSREVYDMCSFSAAHKTLPLPSYVRVTNLDNGRSAIVRVNDRGPFHAGRIIDLSYAAAVKLGVDRTGTARVEVRALTGGADIGASAPALPPAAAAMASDQPQLIQVGAYGERETARRIADQLQAAGIKDVEVDGVRVGVNLLWRVRVGPVAPDAIEGVLGAIRALGLPSPRVFSQ